MPGGIIQELGVGVTDSFQNIGSGVVDFMPKLLIALIIFVAGWLVGAILGRFVAQFVRAIKIDKVFLLAWNT